MKSAKRYPTTAPAFDRKAAFGHPRDYLGNRHVYTVISQRARGLSLGINLNPDQHCNFNCVYCEINRERPGRAQRLDLKVMTAELTTMLEKVFHNRLRRISWFQHLPGELLQLKEVALSGDGEPTLCPMFSEVVKAITRVREQGLYPFKIVLITNTTGLHRLDVRRGLRMLAAWDEVWLKLDAGTQSYLSKVNRPDITLDQVLKNILTLGRKRPVIIQSLFPDDPAARLTQEEIDQYVQRLRALRSGGAQIKLVQIYSAHRPAHRPECKHLPLDVLCDIAQRVREVAGLPAEVF